MCWHGYLSGARCRLAYGPAVMPLPLIVSCFSKIQIGFTFLVPAHLGSPGQRAVKRVCVCCVSLDHFGFMFSNFVLLDLVFFSTETRYLAGKSVSEMICFVSSGT